MPVGIDIVKISRMENFVRNNFPEKIFSKKEAEYINSKKDKMQASAGVYAAKEAVLKSLGCGISLPLSEVEVCHRENGAPYVILSGKVKALSLSMSLSGFDVSISHDGEYAVSYALGIEDKLLSYYLRAMEKLHNAPQNAITHKMIKPCLPKREKASHKGTYGRLCVVAGSKGLTGAAIMACEASLKCGAGLISLVCPEDLNVIFESSLKEVMTKPKASLNGVLSSSSKEEILEDIKNSDLCLIGPGLGKGEGVTEITEGVIKASRVPVVLDADALNAISQNTDVLLSAASPLILTPHIGEFARLTGLKAEEILSSGEEYARAFSQKYNVILVLKSHNTLVSTPSGDVFVNVLGNPGMATGGSGDVLSGTIASFLLSGLSPEMAACAGVYIHSLSADMASFEKGEYSLTPSDIIDYLPYSIKYTQNQEE